MARNEEEYVEEEEVVEEPPGEEDWLDGAVKWTPWWAISIAVHGIGILAAMGFVISQQLPQKEEAPVVDIEPPPMEEVKFEPPRDIYDNKKIIQGEKAVEDPVFIKDSVESDHNETADNEEFEQAKGDSKDFLSDKPFKGQGVYDAIGIGGGGGGKYGGRLGGKRNLTARGGGSQATESAVLAGLKWLSRHQNADGSWDTDGFMSQCGKFQKYPGKCDGPGHSEYDGGNTGLALLAFLGAGYTHLSKDTHDGICFGTVVKNGLQWLMNNQDSEGFIGRSGASKFMYNHTIAALALAEAYGLTGSPLFKDNAQKAIDGVLVAQNPYKAWRYTIKPGDNDSSVTGWSMMALKSAEISGLSIGRAGYDGGIAWYDSVTGDDFRVGYTAKGTGKVIVPGKNEEYEHHEALTAIGIMSRIFVQKNRSDPKLEGGSKLVVQDLPSWDKYKIDYYYWYYASLALFQYDGPNGKYWRMWNESMKNTLVKNQKTSGCENGSWESIDRWSFEGGRVYGTAINVLTLEVYYRYDNVFGVR